MQGGFREADPPQHCSHIGNRRASGDYRIHFEVVGIDPAGAIRLTCVFVGLVVGAGL